MTEPTEPTLRVVIADDELVARKRLSRLLEAMPGVELCGAHEDAAGVLAQLDEDAVDVLVLDIQMPGLTGLELSAMLGADAPYVIFATAHREHAVDAFELGAGDYVLKPIDAARLGRAIERARERRSPVRPTATQAVDRIPIPTREGIVLVDPQSVSHAVFDGSLVTLTTTDGTAHLTEATLQELALRLPVERFERVHRRALLNLHEVAMLVPTDSGGYQARTRAGAVVPVSRQAARKLRRWLGIGRG
jgi:two-component system LytT family response regulator